MSRNLPRIAAAIAAVAALSLPALAQSTASTIRIEPRPYYGATVTLEQGVRVWRPLPPVSHVIVNPDNRTPLSLGLTNVTETVNSNHTYRADGQVAPGGEYVDGGYFGGPLIGSRRFYPGYRGYPHAKRHSRGGGVGFGGGHR